MTLSLWALLPSDGARADGNLDPTFGTAGLVITGFPKAQTDVAQAVAIQSDGKLVAAGYSTSPGSNGFALSRYNTDGTLDTTFGISGLVTTSFGGTNDSAYALAIQADGRIVVAGTSNAAGSDDFAVARYNTNGHRDRTFGIAGTGLVTTNFGPAAIDQATSMTIQPSGKIVLAGTSTVAGSYDFALARYNTDGTLDMTFGTGGLVTTNFGGSAIDVAFAVIQTGTKLVAAGRSNASGGDDFALARYDANGALDMTFGTGGLVTTDFGGMSVDIARTLAVQTNGKLVAAGDAGNDFGLARYDVNGVLDPAFGTGGLVTTSFGGTSSAYAVAIQPDQNLVAAGYTTASGTNDFAVARYLPNGMLDAAFGTGGRVTTSFGASANDAAVALAIQPGGKLVAAGTSSLSGSYDFALVRYNSNGTLDAAFGTGGRVTTDFPGTAADVGRALAIQTDGKLVVAGYSNVSGNNDFALARYNTDGTLDTAFGAGGRVTTNFGGSTDDRAFALAIQSDGKLIAAGTSNSPTTYFDFALARYNTDGTLDTSFGAGGRVTTNFGGASNDQVLALAIQFNGKLVVAGTSTVVNGNFDFALARYDTNGALDPAFGTGGLVTTDFGGGPYDFANALVIQSNNMIVAAGHSFLVGPNYDFALARYLPDGTLDPLFGVGGKVRTNFPGGGNAEFANALVIQPDGKLIAAGTSNSPTSYYDFALVRYNTNGTPDTTFGVAGGAVSYNFGGTSDDRTFALALQSDGKLVAAGVSNQGGSYDFALLRFTADGQSDPGFGLFTTDFGEMADEQVSAMVIQPDGKLVVAGYSNVSGNSDFALARYVPCGVDPDASPPTVTPPGALATTQTVCQ